MAILDELQARVDVLWQKVIYAKSEEERTKYRQEYFKSLSAYKKQCSFIDSLNTTSNEKQIVEISLESTLKVNENQSPDELSGINSIAGAPSPFDFHDYLDFLLAWLRFSKNHGSDTFLQIINGTGLTPLNIVNILKRSKRIRPSEHKKILKYLNLPASESAFLDALYVLSETDSTEERVKVMEQLGTFSPFRKNNPREYEAWKYLTHWYYVVIYEMATLPNFKADPVWIQQQLRSFVPIPNIRSALSFLEGANFIRKSKDGQVISLKRSINCVGGVFRLALSQFHIEMLEQAAGSISRVPSNQRLLISHTMAVPKEKEQDLFKILQETIDKVTALGAGEKEYDEIFHIELAAFPLTKKCERN